MPSIDTEIQINASAEEVWRELIDFASYDEWNSFVAHKEGEPKKGEKLVLRLTPPEGMAMTIKPTVTECIENKKFEWLGRLLMPGIFEGRHAFEIEEQNGTVTLKHYETFGGVLAHPMGWLGIYRKTRTGFVQMNEELKKRVEGRAAETEA